MKKSNNKKERKQEKTMPEEEHIDVQQLLRIQEKERDRLKQLEPDQNEIKEAEQRAKDTLKEIDNIYNSTEGDDTQKLNTLYARLTQEIERAKKAEKEFLKTQRVLSSTIELRNECIAKINICQQIKTQLETACREITITNKKIKENNEKLAREEESKRIEISTKINGSILELQQVRLKKKLELPEKVKKENEELRVRLNKMLEGHQKKEEAYAKKMQEKEAEYKKFENKFQRRMDEEITPATKKIETLKTENEKLREKDLKLKTELQDFMLKFDNFKEDIGKSNEMISNYREDIEKRKKKITQFELGNMKLDVEIKQSEEMINGAIADQKKLDSQISMLKSLCEGLKAKIPQ